MGIQVKGWPLLWMVPLLFLTSTAAGSDPELVVAVREGDHTAVRALLEGDVDVNAPQVYGATVLAWAADRNDLEMLELLMDAGARVNRADVYGVTPLSLACTNGNDHGPKTASGRGQSECRPSDGRDSDHDLRTHGQHRGGEVASGFRSGC